MRTFYWCKKTVFFALQKTKMLNIFQRENVQLCVAEHFPLENVMLNILQSKMYAKMHFCTAEHFPLENVMRCKNAFLHQMHFCTAKMHFGIKCICNILLMRCKNAFVTFCVTKCTHQMHFCKTKCTHQMHL